MRNIFAKYSPLFQLEGGGASGGSVTSGSDTSGSPSPATTPSGPSSTPSSAPSSSEVEPVESGPASDSVDFAFMFNDGEPSTAQPSPKPQVETPPKAPDVQPKPAAGAEPAKPAAAEPTKPQGDTPTAAAPAPTETPSAAQPQLDPYDPGALATALQTNEAQAIAHVAETFFKFTPEEIEELETNTAVAVPKLLAKTFVKSQQNFLQQMARILPPMMAKQTQQVQRHSENEAKFFARWPDLNKSAHGETVLKYASVYRQMNPQTSLEDMIEAVGPMVMMAAKVTPRVGTPAQGASPLAPTGVRPPQPSPFTPAGPLAAGAAPQQAQELTPIEAMFLSPDA